MRQTLAPLSSARAVVAEQKARGVELRVGCGCMMMGREARRGHLLKPEPGQLLDHV